MEEKKQFRKYLQGILEDPLVEMQAAEKKRARAKPTQSQYFEEAHRTMMAKCLEKKEATDASHFDETDQARGLNRLFPYGLSLTTGITGQPVRSLGESAPADRKLDLDLEKRSRGDLGQFLGRE